MPDNNEEGCKRCKVYQELLEKEIDRANRIYSEELNEYDENKLVNDANFRRGVLWGLTGARSLEVVIESKMLQLALNELHCKDCTHES